VLLKWCGFCLEDDIELQSKDPCSNKKLWLYIKGLATEDKFIFKVK
jgi:hypothetical protein